MVTELRELAFPGVHHLHAWIMFTSLWRSLGMWAKGTTQCLGRHIVASLRFTMFLACEDELVELAESTSFV